MLKAKEKGRKDLRHLDNWIWIFEYIYIGIRMMKESRLQEWIYEWEKMHEEKGDNKRIIQKKWFRVWRWFVEYKVWDE